VIETLAAFVLTSLAIEIPPGPNMAYLAVLSLERGWRAGIAAVAGVALGLLSLGIVAGLGLGSVIAESPLLYGTLRWAGVAFLFYLAWDSYREARRPPAEAGASGRLAQFFGRGLVTNLLNPKAVLFYVAVMPNFVNSAGNKTSQTLIFTLVYVAVATFVHAAIALGAAAFQPLLSSSLFRQRAGTIAAVVLVAVAIWVAFATQHR